jgi:hypothetical protein
VLPGLLIVIWMACCTTATNPYYAQDFVVTLRHSYSEVTVVNLKHQPSLLTKASGLSTAE